MKKIILLISIILLGKTTLFAQFEGYRDSVVQIYGVVMTSDSLVALPGTTISVMGRNQGTIANDEGVFSIVVLKGDQIRFTSVGYEPVTVTIPRDIEGNQKSMIQLMTQDLVYLPTTVIQKYPSADEFARAFANTEFPDDKEEIARKNLSEANRKILMDVYPISGTEANIQYNNERVRKAYSNGQAPPQNIFNPFAWSQFIKAWKRGDFKKK